MTDSTDAIDDTPSQPTDRQRTGLRRSQRIGIAVALIVVALVGLAAGAGLSAGDISESIQQRLFGDPQPDREQARLVAVDSSDGYTIEVLLAPTDRGPGECALVRSTGPDWATDDGADAVTRCWLDGPATPWSDPDFRLLRASDRFGLVIEVPLGPVGEGVDAVALVGAVYSDVRAVRAEFGDGSEYTFNLVSDNGWFAVILPDGVADIDRVDGGLVNGVVSLELVDVDGRVLATATPDSNWF